MREEEGKMLFVPDVVTVAKGEQIRFQLNNEGELDQEFVLGTPQEHPRRWLRPAKQHDVMSVRPS